MVLSLRVMTWHRVKFWSTGLYKEVDLTAMNFQIAGGKTHTAYYTQHLKPNTEDAGPYTTGSFIITSYTILLHHCPSGGHRLGNESGFMLLTLHIELQHFRSGECGPAIQNTLKKISSYLPHS